MASTRNRASLKESERFLHDENRGRWAHKLEYLLSCVGYAVGMGNVWRFPYLCYRNGGGAFLIPYLMMLFLCGVPLFYLEAIIGQFSSTGCIAMFRMCPILKGTGYAIIIVNIICVCYYSVLLSYPIRFLFAIWEKKLPWEDCSNSWNTPQCQNVLDHSSPMNKSSNMVTTPADEFFHLEVLKLSSGIEEIGGIVWQLLIALFISWFFIYICIIGGVKSIGKVVYFTATFPYVILLCLFIRGVTLPGATEGIIFYIKPDFNKLTDLKVWADAAVQIFFSLGPGWGGIVNMASYNDFHNNAKFDGFLIPIINSATSIFAGFVVFSVLGYLSEKTGIPVADVATTGPGLAFVTYPQAISLMPIPHIWAFSFFFMLFLLGLDSVFVQIEAVLSAAFDEIDLLRKYKTKVTFIVCTSMFLVSMSMVTQNGMFVLQLLDWYSASIPVICICIMEVCMVSYFYGINKFKNDLYFMLGEYPHKCITFCWKFSTPILLILILITTTVFNRRVTYKNIPYPDWAIGIGWTSALLSIGSIPSYFVYKCVKGPGTIWENICYYTKSCDWAPASQSERLKYERFVQARNNKK